MAVMGLLFPTLVLVFVALIRMSDYVALCVCLFVAGRWVDRNVMSGLLVCGGGSSSLSVLYWLLWLLLFHLLLIL